MTDVLARFAVIAAGYALACLAGAAMLLIAAPETSLFTPPPFSTALDLIARAMTLISLILDAPVTVAAALGLAAVVLAEILRLSSWIFHVLAWGAAGGAAAAASSWLWDAGAPSGVAQEVLIVFIGAGFVSGAVYWLVAGHGA